MAGEELLGPLGALAGAISLVGILGKLHLDEDGRTRKRLEDTERRLDIALEGSKAHAGVADRSVDLAEKAVERLTGAEAADAKYRSYRGRKRPDVEPE